MDFTRQPIIETVITPKEGCKLVIRSSKCPGQEEYFVDALEVVSFGSALFYRSTERPKSFIVPASDYEVLEVREARMVLKNVGVERTIKIGGGRESRESNGKPSKEPLPKEVSEKTEEAILPENATTGQPQESKADTRQEKKRDKRRHSRRRRGREEAAEGAVEASEFSEETKKTEATEHHEVKKEEKKAPQIPPTTPTLLPPPPTLISETIARYKDNALFKGAFYVKEPEAASSEDKPSPQQEERVDTFHAEDVEEALKMQSISFTPSEFGYLDFIEDKEEDETEIKPFLHDE